MVPVFCRGFLDGMSGGFGFPFGCVAAVVAVLSADVAGATGHPWYALVTLGAVVLLTAFWTSVPAALGVAAVAWALDSGFVLGRAGELTFSSASAAAALVFAALVAFGSLARLASRTPAPLHLPSPRPSREIALPSREFRLPSRESRA
jgi:hypothetical protein